MLQPAPARTLQRGDAYTVVLVNPNPDGATGSRACSAAEGDVLGTIVGLGGRAKRITARNDARNIGLVRPTAQFAAALNKDSAAFLSTGVMLKSGRWLREGLVKTETSLQQARFNTSLVLRSAPLPRRGCKPPAWANATAPTGQTGTRALDFAVAPTVLQWSAVARFRRAAAPTKPRPAASNAQVPGSGMGTSTLRIQSACR